MTNALRPVSIVLVHYGDVRPTSAAAIALEAMGLEVVAISNDPTTRPTDFPPQAMWLQAPRNLGYFGALNHAIDQFDLLDRYEVVGVLNTDVDVDLTTILACLEALQGNADLGIVAPVLRFPDRSLQSGAAEWTRWRRAPKVLIEPNEAIHRCGWVTGAAMFVRAATLRSTPPDGSYFLGGEDMDICLRAKDKGWATACLRDAPAVHHQSQVISGPRWYYYSTRNRVWFARQHFGVVAATLNWLRTAALVPRVFAADLLKRQDVRLMATRLTIFGLVDALHRKPRWSPSPLLDEPRPSQLMLW